MPITDSRQEPASRVAAPSFANRFALHAFGGARQDGEDFAQQYARYARESAELMEQISAKAPQLASVLDQLNEGCASGRIELAAPAQPVRRRYFAMRRTDGSLLETATGLLSHAFPGVAPLFHGCRAFLQLKMIKNNKQA